MWTGKRFIRSAGIVVVALAVVLAAFAGAGTATQDSAEAATGAPADLVAAGGNATCLLKSGAVWCQGYNYHGLLGTGTNIGPQTCGANGETGAAPCSYIPVAVSTLTSNVTALSVGGNHACAVQSGAVWCWGYNGNGQLGNNSTTQSFVPFKVPDNAGTGFTNSGITGVSAGASHTCVLQAKSAWCWGLNGNGRLGNNSTAQSLVPVKVSSNAGFTNSNVTAIAAGVTDTCAIESGVAFCWGENVFGQLGNGLTSESHVPVQVLDNAVTGFTNSSVSGIAAGMYHTCAVQGGSAWCWGADYSGQLGNNGTGYSALALRSLTTPSQHSQTAA